MTNLHFKGGLVSFLYEFRFLFCFVFFFYHFVTLYYWFDQIIINRTVQQTYTVPVMCQVQRSTETNTVSEASGLMREGLQRPSSGKGCSVGFHYCFRSTGRGMSVDEVERKAETRCQKDLLAELRAYGLFPGKEERVKGLGQARYDQT